MQITIDPEAEKVRGVWEIQFPRTTRAAIFQEGLNRGLKPPLILVAVSANDAAANSDQIFVLELKLGEPVESGETICATWDQPSSKFFPIRFFLTTAWPKSQSRCEA